MSDRTFKASLLNALLVLVLCLFAVPFAIYAVGRGFDVGEMQEQLSSRLFHSGAGLSNAAIYGHMVAGGIITALAPLQLLRVVRRRAPVLHRISGYLVAGLSVLTGAGGLYYIAMQGTIGGPVMDLGFGLYGALMLFGAFKTVQLARIRHPDHRLWAERLVILALASWLYRVHYGLWEITTGGIGSRPDFSGPFDLVQVFAFYLPYLALHAWVWHRRARRYPDPVTLQP
ncbi:DUF2306 domain-containing protein [Roseobacter weihaiensis]|uniref:DUF2306 domain-containing protein n=1 Tax=Roseobacter weihaiensis TaxID=2763262 RepID=UPI001D09BB90|nr:DUF2306 domain-containing protein [Roseobacter sp. H9]